MASQADFSTDEWQSIYQAPIMAGIVVITAGQTGPVQAIKEMYAVASALAQAKRDPSTNGLINGIAEAVGNKEQTEPAVKPDSVSEAHQEALDHLARVSSLVDAKAADDAPGFKQWLVTIGQHVAEAAKEGSFLGFGGTRITVEEEAALQELRTTLGVA